MIKNDKNLEYINKFISIYDELINTSNQKRIEYYFKLGYFHILKGLYFDNKFILDGFTIIDKGIKLEKDNKLMMINLETYIYY